MLSSFRTPILFLCLLAAMPVSAAVSITVSISPKAPTLRVAASKQFSASVGGTTNRAVTWSVNNVAGGNATVGTIDSTGLYKAPATVPSPNVVTVKATSRAAPAVASSTEVTLLNLVPAISALEPSSVNTGLATTVAVKGSNFLATAVVKLDNRVIPAQFISANELRVALNLTLAAGSKPQIFVTNPAPGAAESNFRTLTVMAPVAVSVSPRTKTLRGGTSQAFGASVSNNSNRKVLWSVNGVAGGNAALGVINADGLYTAPLVTPPAGTVTVKAVADADARASATSTVTLLNPLPVISSVTPDEVKQTTAFTLTLNGTGFTPTSKIRLGAAELATTYLSATQLRATGQTAPVAGGLTAVTVANPDPGATISNAWPLKVAAKTERVTLAAAARLLEQASWGPSPESLAKVQEIGIDAWLEEQFNAPSSVYPDPVDESEGLTRMQRAFFANALTGADQLRQRVAFALGQILVVSGTEVARHHQMVPFQRLLLQHAFGNYRDLLQEVTLSPAMGIYLDMVNNAKPDPAKNILPNENYGRELLQLFALGLTTLGLDGRGADPPPYSEDDIKQITLAFTGWTFPPQPGFQSRWKNPSYFQGRMVAFDDYHDRTAKTIMGTSLPAGRTAQEDLNAALDIVFRHPNVGPFVSLRLIQRLVTGNPSGAYVTRVAQIFNNNGRGVKGDLRAVVKAILTDTEAQGANDGHLREPVLYTTAVLRALNATATGEPSLTRPPQDMGQRLFYAPSVFSYFSPFFRAPDTQIVAPEFQILNPATALARINFIYDAVRNGLTSSVRVDLTNFELLADNPPALLDAVSNALLRGQMPSEMRTSIETAIGATQDRRTRARNALYLAATSNYYQVQR